MLLLSLLRNTFPFTTAHDTIHGGISSIMTNKMPLVVGIIAPRSVVVAVLRSFSSTTVVIGPVIGRIVVRRIILTSILILSVSIRMMIHHHVRMILVAMIVIALVVRLEVVVYVIKVPFISVISISSIVMILHRDTMMLFIERLHHLFASATGVVIVAVIVGITAIVNLGFACLNFAALTEDVDYASFAWNIIKEGLCHLLSIIYERKRRGRDRCLVKDRYCLRGTLK